MLMFQEFYIGTLDMGRINFGVVALIPKVVGASDIRQFRPITVITCWRESLLRTMVSGFDPLVGRVASRAEPWCGRFTSKGSKTVLISANLASLPMYMMGMYILPEGVHSSYDKELARFFWQAGDGRSKYHMVKWADICLPKDRGGLGITACCRMNVALMLRWVWQILHGDGGLLLQLIEAKYLQGRPLLACSLATGSQFWKSIQGIKDEIRLGVRFSVGIGAGTQFWLDPWLDGEPLRLHFPRLFAICGDPAALVSTTAWEDGWHVAFRRPLGPAEVLEWEALQKAPLPLKIKIFVWQLLRDRLPSGTEVLKRHGPGNGLYPLCHVLETGTHILFSYVVAQALWGFVSEALGPEWEAHNLAEFLQIRANQAGPAAGRSPHGLGGGGASPPSCVATVAWGTGSREGAVLVWCVKAARPCPFRGGAAGLGRGAGVWSRRRRDWTAPASSGVDLWLLPPPKVSTCGVGYCAGNLASLWGGLVGSGQIWPRRWRRRYEDFTQWLWAVVDGSCARSYAGSSRGEKELLISFPRWTVIDGLAWFGAARTGMSERRPWKADCAVSFIMDPTEILNVRLHIGGEFVRHGSNLEYVGGDEEMSEIERDKLSFQEVKGFLKDHMEVKDSMKLYFLIPGKQLINGLLLLHDDSGCMRMGYYVCVGGVADIYIEYHQEDDKYSSSGSDFEDELMDICESDASQPDHIISAEPAQDQEEEEYVQLVHDVFVNDCSGVITEVIKSPAKQPRAGRVAAANDELPSQLPISQVCNPTQDGGPTKYETEQLHPLHPEHETEEYQPLPLAQIPASSSDSDSDPEYMAHSDDSGENSEVVEMIRHARKFKKRMRDTKSHNKSSCEKNPERGKKKNAHLTKTTKKGRHQSLEVHLLVKLLLHLLVKLLLHASQPRTSSASQPTSAPSRFRPPRQTTGASGSGARGATRHRGRKDAEDYPSYRYFTAGSGGQD
ncbi:hypothetical protein D1007_49049 [Hordeum vulgare]|nr:hypothetical protein D1007_49049 [Hordeum vulgare]